MASTMFATEMSASAFMGTAVTSTGVKSASRITMGFSKEELDRKPLSLIRTLARQRGIPFSAKHVMIQALLSGTTYTPPSRSSSAPSYPSYSPSVSGGSSEYASLSLGELRALAKSRGLRGDTRAEIISLLASSPAPAEPPVHTSSFSSVAPVEVSSGLPKSVLERKSLSELRALARIRGVRGDTKAELIKLLASDSSAPGPAASASSSYSYSSSGNGAANGALNTVAAKQLSFKSLSQLRAMAAIRGIRGSTKEELVRQLAAVY